nr:MAG: signal peptidase I, archaeal type [Candidatus Nanosalinarum sp. J07AB56]
MDLTGVQSRLEGSRTVDEALFFFLALVLAFGTLQTTGSLLNTDRPVVTVTSCSMYPSLDAGDIVVVQGKEFKDVSEGEIAVYSTDEVAIPVIHRVVEKSEDSLETRGDNNPGQSDFERDVTSGQVHGTYIFKIPKIGLVKLLAADLAGLGGGAPLALDSTPACSVHVPLSQRNWIP